MAPTSNSNGAPSTDKESLEIACDGKSIHCERSGGSSPDLIFTHGAGGTLSADAIANFASGFSTVSPIICFQGSMNLKSRVKFFTAVMEDQNFASCLGGRSMGARAAVTAATDDTEKIILASYPLHTDKEVRDQILLELRPDIQVLFVSGDNDSMCDLARLQEVRKKMQCKTWLITVKDADHGMNVKPKKGSEDVVKMTGVAAARWMKSADEKHTEAEIFWNTEEEKAEQTEWTGASPNKSNAETTPAPKRATKQARKAAKRKDPAPSTDVAENTRVTRSSKRRKQTT